MSQVGSSPVICIVPYDPAWPERFQAFAGPLRALLGKRVAAIHHIGSTGVPGLRAKAVLDVQVTVSRLAEAADWLPQLTGLGLTLRPDVTGDHQPPGMALPDAELAKRYASIPQHTHLHIREAGRFNQRYPLLMRDFLRANAQAAAAYGEIKSQLARLHPTDVDAYYAVKDPVMDLIIDGAEQWAARTNWVIPPPEA